MTVRAGDGGPAGDGVAEGEGVGETAADGLGLPIDPGPVPGRVTPTPSTIAIRTIAIAPASDPVRCHAGARRG
jgi:hypothetical protein